MNFGGGSDIHVMVAVMHGLYDFFLPCAISETVNANYGNRKLPDTVINVI